MTSFYRRMAVVTTTMVLVALALAPCALAGDYHSGSALRCSDCHIMHGSKDGTLYGTIAGDGFAGLLKTGSVNALCLTCHNGNDPNAPDVVAAAGGAPNDTLGIVYASPFKNSAGYFQNDCEAGASAYGHNLGGGHVTAVQGSWNTATIPDHNAGMECTDCHNPHGSSNYRNLVTQPGTASGPIAVRGGVSGAQEVYLREAITIPADSTNTATHYDTSAVRFNNPNNIAQWCMGCHTDITSTSNKHPQNHAISGSEVDPAHWEAGTGAGFGTDVSYASGTGDRGIPRVRFGTTGATDYTSAGVTTTAANNTVTCLTCHKAHGSRVDSTLVWPQFAGSSCNDRTAGCQQCHDKGS